LIGQNLPGLTRSALRALAGLPLVNSYWRHYFLSADRRFRLTVDSNLQFAAACQAAGDGASMPIPLEPWWWNSSLTSTRLTGRITSPMRFPCGWPGAQNTFLASAARRLIDLLPHGRVGSIGFVYEV